MRRLPCSKQITNVSKLKYKFFVFDTETTCLEPLPKNFVFGCLYGYCSRKTFYSVEEFKKEFERPFYKDKYMFAHNAEFDLLTIFGNVFTQVDTSAIFNGKFISAQYKELMFCDSMNIYPTSVAKLGDLIGLPKLENDKAKDGKLKKSNINAHDIEYCMRDCEIVYKALLRIFEMTQVIKPTLPSLAMYDFRHNYIEDDVCFSELCDEFFESYYGGRTEAFYIGKTNSKVYDINSMYAKAMSSVILPDIKRLHKATRCDINYLEHCLNFYEGMAKVTVEHKETFFGYLPCRMTINHTQKLVFPVGEFTTTVNFNELRFAINQGVVKIKKVFYVIWGNPIENIFKEYVYTNFALRKKSNNELEKTIYKLKMNSLYGRFAMRIKMTTTYYEMIPYNKITKLKEDGKYYDLKLFSAVRADCFLITENEKQKNSFFSIPAISSYITSEARLMLLKNLLANENNKVVYCDTDSIFLNDNFVGKVSDKLGDFKLEDKIVTSIKGLKNYIYYDIDGKENVIIKGVSRGSIKTKETQSGETTYKSQRYLKTKASLRQNKEAGTAYTMVKTIRNNYDKREILDDGNTKPLICRNDILINATTFIRPKTNKLLERQKNYLRYEPQNVKEAVMLFFVNGGKIYTKDLIDHVTGRSKEELKSYKGLHDMDGIHMDVFCEIIEDHFYTDRIIDVFQDVLLSFNKAEEMRNYLTSKVAELPALSEEMKNYDFEYDTPF
jgi:hypothetical protein